MHSVLEKKKTLQERVIDKEIKECNGFNKHAIGNDLLLRNWGKQAIRLVSVNNCDDRLNKPSADRNSTSPTTEYREQFLCTTIVMWKETLDNTSACRQATPLGKKKPGNTSLLHNEVTRPTQHAVSARLEHKKVSTNWSYLHFTLLCLAIILKGITYGHLSCGTAHSTKNH